MLRLAASLQREGCSSCKRQCPDCAAHKRASQCTAMFSTEPRPLFRFILRKCVFSNGLSWHTGCLYAQNPSELGTRRSSRPDSCIARRAAAHDCWMLELTCNRFTKLGAARISHLMPPPAAAHADAASTEFARFSPACRRRARSVDPVASAPKRVYMCCK